jgi:hypothetical protein
MLDRRNFVQGLTAGGAAALLPNVGFARTPEFPYRLAQTEIEVFPAQFQNGYTHFRIPSLVSTPNGLLIAFCEGRKNVQDHGDTDILAKHSVDGGMTWHHAGGAPPDGSVGSTPGRHQVVIGKSGFFPGPKINWRNPTAVYAKGKIFLFLIVDESGEPKKTIQAAHGKFRSRFYVLETLNPQTDWKEGLVWSRPEEIVMDHDYLWAQVGPGKALYNNGRLIVPAATNNGDRENSVAFALLSDDLGKSWRSSGPAGLGTETQITTLPDGHLLMSKRTKLTQEFWISTNNGEIWHPGDQSGAALVTPTVQTGLITDSHGRVIITAPNHPEDRVDLSVWYSDGFGPVANWIGPYPLEPDRRCKTKAGCNNRHGYSCPALLPDGTLVVLYEDSLRGEPYRRINIAVLKPN